MAKVGSSLVIKSGSPAETRRLGARLGRLLRPGDVVLLSGELGSGKTCLVQGIARGLGVTGPVTSKSFVLLGEYEGRLRLYHADLYRLEEPAHSLRRGQASRLPGLQVLATEHIGHLAGLHEGDQVIGNPDTPGLADGARVRGN